MQESQHVVSFGLFFFHAELFLIWGFRKNIERFNWTIFTEIKFKKSEIS